MDILFGFVVVHHTCTGHIGARALGDADSHACRHFDASLGGGIRDRLHLLQCGIPQNGIHITVGAVHGEGTANGHLGIGTALFQGMFDIRAAQSDGTEEIRSRKGNGFHCGRVHRLIFH